MTSPSTERISRSKPNLSATSLASVGSRRSFTMRITPSSSNALITSPDLRRIFSAISATVTDSPTLRSSRRISTGGVSTAIAPTDTGSTLGADFGGTAGTAGDGNVMAAAAGRSTRGRGGAGGGIGRGGPTVTRGGANGPVG
jgi:hypothetical protein